MTEHTPGRWDFAVAEPDIHRIGIYANDGETIICDVTSEDLQVTDQFGANARLIAAAPELLAACEACLAWFEHENDMADDDLRRCLSDAITKARGATP